MFTQSIDAICIVGVHEEIQYCTMILTQTILQHILPDAILLGIREPTLLRK